VYIKSLNITFGDKWTYVESFIKSTNVLQEEDPKNIILGMSMHPQEDHMKKMKKIWSPLILGRVGSLTFTTNIW
jgi:glycine/serine hydroxymethyltransferase